MFVLLLNFSIACRRYSWEILLVQSDSSFCSMLFCDCSSILTSRCNRSSCRCRLIQLPTISEANNTSCTITERLICRFIRQPLVFSGVMIYLGLGSMCLSARITVLHGTRFCHRLWPSRRMFLPAVFRSG
jgi:hypothetical protein